MYNIHRFQYLFNRCEGFLRYLSSTTSSTFYSGFPILSTSLRPAIDMPSGSSASEATELRKTIKFPRSRCSNFLQLHQATLSSLPTPLKMADQPTIRLATAEGMYRLLQSSHSLFESPCIASSPINYPTNSTSPRRPPHPPIHPRTRRLRKSPARSRSHRTVPPRHPLLPQ